METGNFHRNRRIFALVGEQRSGKSYFANWYAANYCKTGANALVYNLGKPYDFAGAKMFNFLNFKETNQYLKTKGWSKEQLKEYNEDAQILFFKNGKNIERIENFNSILYGQFLKMPRMRRAEENSIWEQWFLKISNTLLILDDCKSMFRYGLSEDIITMLSRANHTGTQHTDTNYLAKGTDIMLILHSLDQLNDDIFHYLTDVILFKCHFEPNWQNISNVIFRQELKALHNELLISEKYCFAGFNLDTGGSDIFNPI